MNIAFLCVGIALAAIGYDYYNKAKSLPKTNEAEIKAHKKAREIGVSFLLSGFTFFILAVSKFF